MGNSLLYMYIYVHTLYRVATAGQMVYYQNLLCRYAFVDRYSPGTASVFWAQQETASITEGNYNYT